MENKLQYLRCKTAVIDYIAQHELAEGSCLPAQRKLCDILGFSMITLRRALFELEQLGMVEAKSGKGVFVRKSLAKWTGSGRILLLDINAPFREIDTGIRYLLRYVRKRGYEFRTVSAGSYPNDLILQEIDQASGLIVTGVISDSWKYLLKNSTCPIVNIGEADTHFEGVKTVYVDDLDAIRQAIDYFKACGCRKFALINTSKTFCRSTPFHFEFQKYLEAQNLPYSADLELYTEDSTRNHDIREFVQRHSGKFDCILIESGLTSSLLAGFYEYDLPRVPIGIIGGSWNYIRPEGKRITLFGAKEPIFQTAADVLIDAMRNQDKQIYPEGIICIKPEMII